MPTDEERQELAGRLLARSGELLIRWLPGGEETDSEYKCADLTGGRGDTLNISTLSGSWSGIGIGKGPDLITLYSYIQRCSQDEAFQRLSTEMIPAPVATPRPVGVLTVCLPPEDQKPEMVHDDYGTPSESWLYRDATGRPMFWTARYDLANGKEYVDWCWSPESEAFVTKGWPAPRPLYGLDLLAQRPDDAVMVVQGVEAAEAGRVIAGKSYVVVTWPGGPNGHGKADWAPLHGRKVLIWPIPGPEGSKTARVIASRIVKQCLEVKIISPNGQPEGWGASEALQAGWDWASLASWAKDKVSVFKGRDVVKEATLVPTPVVVKQVPTIGILDKDPDLTVDQYTIHEEIDTARTKDGKPVCNLENALRVVERIKGLQGIVWWDDFHQKIFTTWNNGGVTREWNTVDDHNLLVFFQRQLAFQRLTLDHVRGAILVRAHQDIRNEPKDWMESLAWDHEPRLETFFVEAMGADDNEYSRAASMNWWISMAARIYDPGCQVDTMVVLEGAQGIFKSTALKIIGDPWFFETHESVLQKDFFQNIQGMLIVCIDELHSFGKAEIEAIKGVITRRMDRYRGSYDARPANHLRQCVLAGTTNQHKWMRDETGGRRFIPIKVGIIKVDLIRELRSQLFAEAVHRYKAGEKWHVMPIKATLDEQEMRYESDPWEPRIADWIENNTELTVDAILELCLRLDAGKWTFAEQRRVGKILRRCGWMPHVKRCGKIFKTVWRPPAPEFPAEAPGVLPLEN